jgi:hypothetical protein
VHGPQGFRAIIPENLYNKPWILGVESMLNQNFQSLLKQTIGLGSIGVIALTGALAIQSPTLAQDEKAAGLVGQCRAVNKQTPLYKERNTSSEAVTLLKGNEKVTLAENAGASGLISVSAPAKGFVLMANLKACPGSTTPPATGSCRLVVQKQGLAVRKEPGSGEVVGGVALNDKVTLVSPPEKTTATDGRDWVKISKPVAGWVSEGFKDQTFKNLAACP